ncbi:MAG: hypothetical protein LBR10_14310 [Prevotellaceae bacterium]|jgi:hypothetical protein|nr:hypothetical protein [Prevotellaceae bacterium]
MDTSNTIYNVSDFQAENDLDFNLIKQIEEYFVQEKKPIIVFGEKPLKDRIKTGTKETTPRHLKFLDSSIWIRYASDDTELTKLRKEVEEYAKRGLYNTTNALESREFKARLCSNSWLTEINGSSHAGDVVPFVFHSETEMHEKAKNEQCEKLKEKKLKWCFLLIDDHATIESVENDSKDKPNILPKCKIIQNVLSEYFNLKCSKGKECECFNKCSVNNNSKPLCKYITIYLDCVTKIKDDKGKIMGAKSKIKKTKYDLILMDYLLGSEKWNRENKESRKYATDFLKEIQSCCDSRDEKVKNIWKKIKGPNGAFRIFFISAFTNAVNERMLAEGLSFTEDYWHISRGACPTTTPHLFSYFLLKAMNEQIEKMSDNVADGIITLLDMLLKIFEKTDKAREKAIKNFNNLLRMRARYDDLKYDACLGIKKRSLEKDEREQYKSKLVNSLFTDIEHYDNALWEHVIHLVYLTAYGTIRQWHEIWEEYMLIKPYLQKALKESVKDENDNPQKDTHGNDISANPKAKDVMEKIEEYISHLRNQS